MNYETSEVWDHVDHVDYHPLSEIWYSRFGVTLTNKFNPMAFIGPHWCTTRLGSAFSKELLDHWGFYRTDINSMLIDFMNNAGEEGVMGLHGIYFRTEPLLEFCDMIEEEAFYSLVEREEQLKAKEIREKQRRAYETYKAEFLKGYRNPTGIIINIAEHYARMKAQNAASFD